MRYNVALFDLYGTLADVEVDEEAPEAWTRLDAFLQPRSCELRPEGLHESFLRLCKEEVDIHGEGSVLAKTFERLLNEIGASESNLGVVGFAQKFREVTTKKLISRPYTVPVLERLRSSGVRRALVSNTEGLLSHYDVAKLGLDKYFDAMLFSSEIGSKKPCADIFRRALTMLSVAPEKAVFIGDTWETDIVGALNSGLAAIYLDSNLPEGVYVPDAQQIQVFRAHPDEKAISLALGI